MKNQPYKVFKMISILSNNGEIMSIVLTGKIAEVVISVAEKRGFSPEEYLSMKVLEDLDPKTRITIYIELFKKYLKEAREYTDRGDFPQACEKYWGAITSLLNIVGELKNMNHYKHSDYWEIMEVIASETSDQDLPKLFATAEKMHANYYHNFIKKENFPSYAKGAEELIEKLISYIEDLDKETAKKLRD